MKRLEVERERGGLHSRSLHLPLDAKKEISLALRLCMKRHSVTLRGSQIMVSLFFF
jgi:hypothetical protein